jgi:putative membrane protein
VLPLVESRVPVSSVRRIVIKHSESIEETAAVFTKYVRLLVDEPKYSRIALGLPGILVLILGILWAIDISGIYTGALSFYYLAIVIVLGGFLLLKGFGVDRATKNFFNWAKNYEPPSLPIQISNYTVIAGILCIAVSVYLGAASVNINAQPFPTDAAGWVSAIPVVAGYFLLGVEDLMIVGACIVLLGRCIKLYFERDSKLLRNIAFIVTVAWFNQILDKTGKLLLSYARGQSTIIGLTDTVFSDFLFTIIVGILIGVASILLIYIVNKSSKGFFNKENKPDEL